MRLLSVFAAAVLVAASAHMLLVLRRPPSVSGARVAEVAPAATATAAASAPAPGPAVDVRAQIRRAVAEAQPRLQTTRDVERYLEELQAQARRNHQVGALELEPGIQAIRAVYDPEHAAARLQEFTTEMARLSAELDGRDRQPPPDLERLAHDLERAGEGTRRQELVRQYVMAVGSLPPEDQARRMAWLDQRIRSARVTR